MDYAELIAVLLQGIGALVARLKNKTVDTAIADAEVIDQVVLAVLKKSAEVKGITIDWSDPLAVSAYVSALPQFVPIPDASPDTAALPGASAPTARLTGDNG